jgi:hypothetical protein
MDLPEAACDPPAKSGFERPGVTVTRRPDAGEITLGRTLRLGFVVLLACLLFLFFDTKHRMAGYQAVHGDGIPGGITVTKCDSRWLGGTTCVGNFVSSDGKIQRHGIHVNGVKAVDAQVLPAAIGGEHAKEAWTSDGTPWLDLSAIQVAALIPLVVALAAIWTFLRGGPRTWRTQSRVVRARVARGRAAARERQVRMGRVH